MAEENTYQCMLPEGATLQSGKYRVERQIASGGFGNTYEVMNVEFEERMALKEFFIKGLSERESDTTTVSVSNTLNKSQFETQKDKFKKEARRLRKLHHPHIVQVHDLFEENGTAYYAMDFVDGESLSNRLKRTKQPLSEAEALEVFNQVLDALENVHAQGIWHLDLKPGNIMVDHEGCTKVIDFGASKQLNAADGSYTTTTTAMCYTPGYAPTEQIDQKMELIGAWTDLYALGGTLYNLLTMKQPPTVSEMQEDNAFQFPDAVSAKTRQLIQWMMTPRRQSRPQSVADVRAFLASTSATPPAPPTPPVPPAAPAPPAPPKPSVAKVNEEKEEKNKADEETLFIQHSGKKTKQPPVQAQKSETPTSSAATSSDSKSSSTGLWVLVGVIAFVLVGVCLWLLLPSSGSEEKEPVDEGGTEEVVEVPTVTDLYFESGLGVCSYTGEVDENNTPHGKGVASFTDGREYKGPFVHGKMEGQNAYFRYDNGDTFEGTFVDNGFSHGRYTMKSDGSYFIGDFAKGQPSKGEWYDKNGKKM